MPVNGHNTFQSPLFLTDTEDAKAAFRDLISRTTNAVINTVSNGNAYCGLSPAELKEAVSIPEILPQQGKGLDAVTDLLSKKILPYFLRTASTDYMAHLHSPALLETIAAELVLTTFNQSMDSWDQSPVATEIELNVINTLCRLYGYDSASGIVPDGVFTSGGSQSNMTGLLLARDWFCRTVLNYDVKKYGLPENYRKFRLYTSEISHFSMEKSAHILGLGYDSVVKVPVDNRQRIDIETLRSLILQDIACGNVPFCIVATIGTTDYGSIDSVDKIHELCEEYNLWLHADAAYGSGVILSDKYHDRIGRLNLCNSITVDFHKMFLMPVSCSAVLLKNKQDFEPLELHADYLNREEDEEDGYTNLVGKSMQTTRRFDALKVWIAFQIRGKDGWNQLISTCIENAAYLYRQLKANPRFEPVTEPEISSVVFRILPSGKIQNDADTLNKTIRRRLIHEHGVVIGQTTYRQNIYLKFTLLNPLVTHEKLDKLLNIIVELADTVHTV